MDWLLKAHLIPVEDLLEGVPLPSNWEPFAALHKGENAIIVLKQPKPSSDT
jgi:hypothetical protein